MENNDNIIDNTSELENGNLPAGNIEASLFVSGWAEDEDGKFAFISDIHGNMIWQGYPDEESIEEEHTIDESKVSEAEAENAQNLETFLKENNILPGEAMVLSEEEAEEGGIYKRGGYMANWGGKYRRGGEPTPYQKGKVHKVMTEFKQGKLKSHSGEKVTDRDQAVAIALSEAGLSKKHHGGYMYAMGGKVPEWYKGEGYYVAKGDGTYVFVDSFEVEEYKENGNILYRRIGRKSDDNLSYIDDDNLESFYENKPTGWVNIRNEEKRDKIKSAIKSKLIDLASEGKLPTDMAELNSSEFYDALGNIENRNAIALEIKKKLLDLSLDDQLPMDMNDLDTSVFDKVFNSFMNQDNYHIGIKKGDTVIVNAGRFKNEEAIVLDMGVVTNDYKVEFSDGTKAIIHAVDVEKKKYDRGGAADISFQKSNLYLVGKGRDVNGNYIVKVTFPNQRAFSIQTQGNLNKTEKLLKSVDSLEELTQADINEIEKEVVAYVKEYGSDQQKKSLRTYDKYAQGGKPEHYRYLDIEKTSKGLKLSLNEDGIEEALRLREEDKLSDDAIISELFDDVRGNSEYIFIEDAGNAGIAMTGAPVILDGYHIDDDGKYETDYPESAKMYYFGNYAVISPLEVMLKDGSVTFDEVKEMGGSMYAKGGKVKKYSNKFEQVSDSGDEKYFIRDFSEVETHKNKSVPLVAVAHIQDLTDAVSEEELEPLKGKNIKLDITIVPYEKYISKELLNDANDEDSKISDNSEVNLANYAGGLNYQPEIESFFYSIEDAEKYLTSKEVETKITTDGALAGFILDRQYNRAGKSNWDRLYELTGESEYRHSGGMTYAKGGDTEKHNKRLDAVFIAKPKGWRFKGENYHKPTASQIEEDKQKPLKLRMIYYEGRDNRSDRDQRTRFNYGGDVYFKYGGSVNKKWIQQSLKHEESLRRKAHEMGLIKGDETLSEADLKKLQNLGGVWPRKVAWARTVKKFREGGNPATVKDFLQSLDAKMIAKKEPSAAKFLVQQMLKDPNIELLDVNDPEFLQLKSVIEQTFPLAIPSYKAAQSEKEAIEAEEQQEKEYKKSAKDKRKSTVTKKSEELKAKKEKEAKEKERKRLEEEDKKEKKRLAEIQAEKDKKEQEIQKKISDYKATIEALRILLSNKKLDKNKGSKYQKTLDATQLTLDKLMINQ